MAPEQGFLGIIDTGHPRHRGNHLVLFLPRIRAIIRPENLTADDLEIFPELIYQFAFPLEGEIGRGDDQGTLRQTTDFELLDEEPCHDRFAGAGIIRQKEPDAGKFQKVVVDRLKLVEQRINARNGEGEVGIVFIGKAEAQAFDAEPKAHWITVKWFLLRGCCDSVELVCIKDRIIELIGAQALPNYLH